MGVVVGQAAARHRAPVLRLAKVIDSRRFAVENVYFRGRPPVKIVRGGNDAPRRQAPLPPVASAVRSQTISFGAAGSVTIVRGGDAAAGVVPAALRRRVETVSFADSRLPAVTVVREWGIGLPPSLGNFFGPANGGELDRIAFAVDGIESRHGADLAMWRPELSAPQGPMQVSAAAAIDVGGGDRFDLKENRLLGRAYLAQMFRRYGDWPDALAAYNWGPANLDKWIAGGRDPYQMPPGVAWYITRAMRDALITTDASR